MGGAEVSARDELAREMGWNGVDKPLFDERVRFLPATCDQIDPMTEARCDHGAGHEGSHCGPTKAGEWRSWR